MGCARCGNLLQYVACTLMSHLSHCSVPVQSTNIPHAQRFRNPRCGGIVGSGMHAPTCALMVFSRCMLSWAARAVQGACTPPSAGPGRVRLGRARRGTAGRWTAQPGTSSPVYSRTGCRARTAAPPPLTGPCSGWRRPPRSGSTRRWRGGGRPSDQETLCFQWPSFPQRAGSSTVARTGGRARRRRGPALGHVGPTLGHVGSTRQVCQHSPSHRRC